MSNMRVITTGLEFPEGPVVMNDGSVILVEIMARAADAGLPGRPQGDGGEDAGRTEWRRHGAGWQDLRHQQWRVRLDQYQRLVDSRAGEKA